jgi:hypothetical protein
MAIATAVCNALDGASLPDDGRLQSIFQQHHLQNMEKFNGTQPVIL